MNATVGILGGSGYAGGELLRLLAQHPHLRVVWAAADSAAGQPVTDRYPGLTAAYGALTYCTADEGLEKGADVLFLALPHGQAAQLVGRVLTAAGLVVDLSADFRLRDPGAYPTWYGAAHPAPEQLGGLVAGDSESYRYLVESIRRFPTRAAFARMIGEAGFRRVTHRAMSGGIVAIHSGWKF